MRRTPSKEYVKEIATKIQNSKQQILSDSFELKESEIDRLVGGVLVHIETVEQAMIAENAGARGIIVDNICKHVYRSVDPGLIKRLKDVITIPIIGCVRIGHFVEAEILEVAEVDFIYETDQLPVVNQKNHINKSNYKTPFLCCGYNYKDYSNRVEEGGSIVCCRCSNFGELISRITEYTDKCDSKLTLPHFVEGCINTPADAAMVMRLGANGILLESSIFSSLNAEKRIKAICESMTCYEDQYILSTISEDLHKPSSEATEYEIH